MKKQAEICLSAKNYHMMTIPYDEIYLNEYKNTIKQHGHIILVEFHDGKKIFTIVPANMLSSLHVIADIVIDYALFSAFDWQEKRDKMRGKSVTFYDVNDDATLIRITIPFYVNFDELNGLCRAICNHMCYNKSCSVSIKTIEKYLPVSASAFEENEKETQVEIIVYNENLIPDNQPQ